MNDKFAILVIENNQNAISCIQRAFDSLHDKGTEFAITIVDTVNKVQKLQEEGVSFDLMIIEINLTESKGVDTIKAIQKFISNIPIIAIAESADKELVREVIRLGAQDYLPKNELDPEHLQRVIYNSIERNRLRQSLRALSFTDEMTGLYNRRGFFTLLEQQLSIAERSGEGFYLFLIDLDYLKTINDNYGHPTGDRALMHIADCLNLAFRHHDIIGRIGGDEFAVIAIHATADSKNLLKENVYRIIQELNEKTTEPYQLSISIGAAYYPGFGDFTIDSFINDADKALYAEKKKSHSRRPSREQMRETD